MTAANSTSALPLPRGPTWKPSIHGAEGTRTLDPRLAKPMLSQLSYGPEIARFESSSLNRATSQLAGRHQKSAVGARRVELRTSSLSATRSNQLSYAPSITGILAEKPPFLNRTIVDFRCRLSNGPEIELVMRADFVLSLSAIACRGTVGKLARCRFRVRNRRENMDCSEYDGCNRLARAVGTA